MGWLDVYYQNGNMKGAAAVAKAVYWMGIRREMEEQLTSQQITDLVLPILQQRAEDGE